MAFDFVIRHWSASQDPFFAAVAHGKMDDGKMYRAEVWKARKEPPSIFMEELHRSTHDSFEEAEKACNSVLVGALGLEAYEIQRDREEAELAKAGGE